MLSADNSRKTPLPASLNQVARQRAAEETFSQGREYPCRVESVNGQLVTVSIQVFGQPYDKILPNLTVPIATSVYDWVPVQVGDLGLLKKSDVYLGGVSGLGGGTADYTPRGNLSTLFYVPISNKAWAVPASASSDDAVRVVQGPHGVAIQDTAGKSTMLLNATSYDLSIDGGKVTIVVSGDQVTVTVPSGKKVIVTAGGTPHRVITETGASPVLWADGS